MKQSQKCKSNKSREVKFIIAISKNPEPLLQKLITPFPYSPLQKIPQTVPPSVKKLV